MLISNQNQHSVSKCIKWNMSIGDTIQSRASHGLSTNGMHNCYLCNYEFTFTDIPYIIYFRNNMVKFICHKCALNIKI